MVLIIWSTLYSTIEWRRQWENIYCLVYVKPSFPNNAGHYTDVTWTLRHRKAQSTGLLVAKLVQASNHPEIVESPHYGHYKKVEMSNTKKVSMWWGHWGLHIAIDECLMRTVSDIATDDCLHIQRNDSLVGMLLLSHYLHYWEYMQPVSVPWTIVPCLTCQRR